MVDAKRRRGRPRKLATLELNEFVAVLELLVYNAKRHRTLSSCTVQDNKLTVAFCVPLFGFTQRLASSVHDKPVAKQLPEQLKMPL